MVVHQNTVGTLWYHDWYWHLRINEGIDVTPDQAEEFHVKAEELDKPMSPLLIDKFYSYSPTFETLQLVRDYYPHRLSAVAWLVRTRSAEVSSEIVRETFLNTMPAGIFYDIEEALEWMKKFRPTPGPARQAGDKEKSAP